MISVDKIMCVFRRVLISAIRRARDIIIIIIITACNLKSIYAAKLPTQCAVSRFTMRTSRLMYAGNKLYPWIVYMEYEYCWCCTFVLSNIHSQIRRALLRKLRKLNVRALRYVY